MPLHLDISALHFPDNRWKRCIKAPRGNPGHPGIAEARPGSGGAGGHLFHALNRSPHPPSRGELGSVCVCVCVCTVLVSWCVTSLLLRERFTVRLPAALTNLGAHSSVAIFLFPSMQRRGELHARRVTYNVVAFAGRGSNPNPQKSHVEQDIRLTFKRR